MRNCGKWLSILLASILLSGGTGLGQPSTDERTKERGVKKQVPAPPTSSKRLPMTRDPFGLPKDVKPLSQVQPPPQSSLVAASPSLELRAILLSDRLRLASINHQIVMVGDLVDGERVTEIHADRVVLEKEGKKRTLFLSQSPLRLNVEMNRGKGEK